MANTRSGAKLNASANRARDFVQAGCFGGRLAAVANHYGVLVYFRIPYYRKILQDAFSLDAIRKFG